MYFFKNLTLPLDDAAGVFYFYKLIGVVIEVVERETSRQGIVGEEDALQMVIFVHS